MQALVLFGVARSSTPEALGITMAVQGLLAFFAGAAGLGLGPYALRNYARDGSVSRLVIKLNVWSSCVTSGVAATLMLCMVYISQSGSSIWIALAPLALWMGAEKNTELWSNLAVAQGRSQVVATALLINRIAILFSYLIIESLTGDAILGYTSGLAAGAVIGNVLLRKGISASVVADTRRPFDIIREAFPFLMNTLGAQVRNLDVTVVAAVTNSTIAGLYALPARLISPLRMVPAAVAPVIVRYSAFGGDSAIKVVRFMVLMTMSVSGGMVVIIGIFARPLVNWMFGDSYQGAALPLQIICGGLVFAFGATLLTSVLQGRGQEKNAAWVTVLMNLAGLFAVGLGAVFGAALGAAVGLASSYFVHLTVLVVILLHDQSRRAI